MDVVSKKNIPSPSRESNPDHTIVAALNMADV
jgi:hypothetical protein